MKRALIADDHEVTRRGLREIVRDAVDDVEIEEAASASAVVAALARGPWDLILLDVLMPGGTVLDVLAAIRKTDPRVPVLVVTAVTEIEYVLQSLKAGANGLIHKSRAADDLVRAISIVSAGGRYLHPETALEVASALREDERPAAHTLLSPRELDVLKGIARGRAVKEVAGDLGLSDKTIATYLARIREKTGLTSHVEIARYALRNGLVD